MADFVKIDENIPFPEYTSYSLTAVVVHHGSISGGHYTAFIKHRNQRWYLCNDSQVRPATAKEVRSSQAYILFYEREDVSGKRTTSSQRQLQGNDESSNISSNSSKDTDIENEEESLQSAL